MKHWRDSRATISMFCEGGAMRNWNGVVALLLLYGIVYLTACSHPSYQNTCQPSVISVGQPLEAYYQVPNTDTIRPLREKNYERQAFLEKKQTTIDVYYDKYGNEKILNEIHTICEPHQTFQIYETPTKRTYD
jgi:hypothetical protein